MSEHTLPQLPYAYNALEPAISEEIMTIHHTKHHQLYITNLNNAIKAYNSAISSNDVRKQIELQGAIKFNGGGHINHSLFWKNLAPSSQGGGQLQDGPLKQAIERDFGSLDNLKSTFNATIATIQGSGWGWLGFNPKNSKLEVVNTQNQDPLISHHPIIGVDAWEHAFYLQYKNVKAGKLLYYNCAPRITNPSREFRQTTSRTSGTSSTSRRPRTASRPPRPTPRLTSKYSSALCNPNLIRHACHTTDAAVTSHTLRHTKNSGT